jgi:hypothetical protein
MRLTAIGERNKQSNQQITATCRELPP